jgi:hypothetical protein
MGGDPGVKSAKPQRPDPELGDVGLLAQAVRGVEVAAATFLLPGAHHRRRRMMTRHRWGPTNLGRRRQLIFSSSPFLLAANNNNLLWVPRIVLSHEFVSPGDTKRSGGDEISLSS